VSLQFISERNSVYEDRFLTGPVSYAVRSC